MSRRTPREASWVRIALPAGVPGAEMSVAMIVAFCGLVEVVIVAL
jgi:hypothetical protein